ncbi:hypothetical protein [Polyangium jinanense]|uniref:Uncharacterized protein n=1 Tax=Polyangium jinanense TaxID=2829994 RepID=A0A9X3X9G8_9BACT|nr:hypothetical protein [Polyangium jinanense]MDC3957176.1 hypothetical protein [Polyangium jinanense]MDC3986667.1 hypothetical protein [Polyangium jinanense]
MENLVPDEKRRAALEASGNKVVAAVKQLVGAYVARIVFEYVDQRIALGKGRGVDRGFDAVIAVSSETIRTSLPDRRTSNPEYSAIFPNGTEEYTSPTVKEDEELALDLRKAVHDSTLSVKADVLALLDKVIPIVGPAASGVREGEKQVNALFQTELAARKLVVDTLWEERKAVENALGRGGRGLARFIYFDFRKGRENEAAEEPAGAAEPGAPEKP